MRTMRSIPSLLAAMALGVSCGCHVTGGSPQPQGVALIRIAATDIDSVLGTVADSTRAIAAEYALATRRSEPPTDPVREYWLERYRAKGETVMFQTWPGELDSPPAFQAEAVAFFTYRGTEFSSDTFRQLELFREMTPLIRSAYRTFHYSWSYVTTAEGAMMIYPFLTLDEAVNNEDPTRQVYYTSADFERRAPGWTAPYLDLVGAGMMITVSTPAYDGDRLLGVVSHDITLKQLSETVLRHLAPGTGDVAWLVDGTGLVIGVSDRQLAAELDRVNRAAGAAVLHYLPAEQLRRAGLDQARPSDTSWINEVTSEVMKRSHAHPSAFGFESDGRQVAAIRTELTGWLLIRSSGQAPAR